MSRLRIAVIGTGAAGLTAAYLLRDHHDVFLFEKNDYAGGHTHTIIVPNGPDAGTPIDTGFIVLNDKNYPLLHKLLAQLGCQTRWSDMSFGFCSKVSGLTFAGTGLGGIFAQRANLFRPSFYKLLADIVRFCRRAQRDLEDGTLDGRTLRSYLSFRDVSPAAIQQYIIPMSSAIWSASGEGIFDFPAQALLRFWNNHGLLSLENRPRWQTVVGGSQTYVQAILKSFDSRVELGALIAHVRRTPDGVLLTMRNGESRRFDRVVMAAHADESLALLADPTEEEQRLLGAWSYARNRTVLHTDTSFLPPNRRAWASWNYVEEPDARANQPASVTYWMNRLQGLNTRETYCVTLNPTREIPDGRVIAELDYSHPQYTFDAVASQHDLRELNGPHDTFFCGSYFGYGFHEDAVRSGVDVAKCFGLDL